MIGQRGNAIRNAALAIIVLLVMLAAALHAQGRVGWCACQSFAPWSGEVISSHNSQHLVDPYSLTHIVHGILLTGLLWPLRSRLGAAGTAVAVLALEAGWELIENSEAVIRKYREATISLNYFGDSIANSLGDLLMCALGIAIATRLRLRHTVVIAAAFELILLLWIRDNLVLNVLMLLWPMESIKHWQGPWP